MRRRRARERGAAVVEFALLLPLLLLIIAGIIDVSRLLFTEVMVVNASREGARMIAMGYTPAEAQTKVTNSVPGIFGGPVTIYSPAPTVCPTDPLITDEASVTVKTTTFDWVIVGTVSKFFGSGIPAPQPSSTAVMRCLG